MKSTLLTIILAMAGSAYAAEAPGSQFCESIVTKIDSKKGVVKTDTKPLTECQTEFLAGQKKCSEQFNEAIKKYDNHTKKGLLQLLNESKKLSTCGTDVSINLVKKYYQ